MRPRLSIATVLCSLPLSSVLLAGPNPDDPWLWYLEAEFTGYDSPSSDLFGYSVALDGDTALIGQYGEEWGGSAFGAAYVYVDSGSGWSQQARLAPSDPAPGAWFGWSVALQGDTALVGAVQDDDDLGIRTGAAYVFTRSAGIWTEVAKITPPDGEAYDYFGRSVALGGNVALIGAPWDDGAAGDRQGSAYVFIGSGASWTLLQKLEPSDPKALGQFGESVALSATTALIGSPWAAGNHFESGGAYVFTKAGGAWNEEAKLYATYGGYKDRFGQSVALQGDRALIGAPYDDDNGQDSGSAYVYVRSASGWEFQAKLGGGVSTTRDQFGFSVCLSGDVAVVGAPGYEYAAPSTGSAHVYVRVGSTWTHQAELTASDGMLKDLFGHSVSLSGDTLVIGAHKEDTDGDDTGAAYVFVWTGSLWRQEAKLKPALLQPGAEFGTSVSISGDTAVIGALWYPTPGTAYVFERSGMIWTEMAKLVASDGGNTDRFGHSVSLDGDTMLIGVYGADDACPHIPDCHSGAVYVFVGSGSVWTEQAKLLSDAPEFYSGFGYSVSLDGDTALISEPTANNGAPYAGVVHEFRRTGSTWTHQTRILAGDAAHSDFYGRAVDLEGKMALIGAPGDGGASDRGSAYIYRQSGPPGEAYCFGEPDSGTPCPCNNDNDRSLPESGCANGVFASGARLTGAGVASVTSDTLVLTCVHQEPLNSGLYFQGNNDASPGLPWGDGLQCAGGFLVRLQVRQADASGASSTTIGIADKAGNVTAGSVKFYQCWYRNPAGSPCGHEFNASNGLAVTWTP